MAGVNFGTAAAEAIRRDATQMKLDAVAAEMAAGSVMRFGERAPGKPTPNMVRDLPFTCPTCGTAKLCGMSYHVFVSGDSDRFMVWAEGACPACMSRQVVIWDPLDVASVEAQTKVRDERETLVRDWMAQLEEPEATIAAA